MRRIYSRTAKDRRIEKVRHTLQKELSSLIMTSISDPRLPPMTSITAVHLYNDLSVARVMVSAFGKGTGVNSSVKAVAILKSASGALRTMLGQRLRMKQIPRLHFQVDSAIHDSARMEEIIAHIHEITPSTATHDKEVAG